MGMLRAEGRDWAAVGRTGREGVVVDVSFQPLCFWVLKLHEITDDISKERLAPNQRSTKDPPCLNPQPQALEMPSLSPEIFMSASSSSSGGSHTQMSHSLNSLKGVL